MAIPGSEPPAKTTTVGVHGVRLKRFESVVAKLLSASIEPDYVRLPPPPPALPGLLLRAMRDDSDDSDHDDDWLFSRLPLSARVVGKNHPHPERARRKEGQVRSMLRGVLNLTLPLVVERRRRRLLRDDDDDAATMPPGSRSRPVTVVDFGGGSGHLGIPLALLLPECRIVVVDFNRRSIDLLHEKARAVVDEVVAAGSGDDGGERRTASAVVVASAPDVVDAVGTDAGAGSSSSSSSSAPRGRPDPLLRRCGGPSGGGGVLSNLFTFAGPVQAFEEDFDVAVALHLCGEATDVCLRKAATGKAAAAIVVAPCCVGKLSGSAVNPDVYHATGGNDATVEYPQSERFGTVLSSSPSSSSDASMSSKTTTTTPRRRRRPGREIIQRDWNALAKAADYSDEREVRTSRNASRRTAKALLETDRRLFLEKTHGYSTALAKMDPPEVTPKNDILVAWDPEAYRPTAADGESGVGGSSYRHPEELFGTPDVGCRVDLEVARAHLLPSTTRGIAPGESSPRHDEPAKQQQQQPPPPPSSSAADRNDWTREEEASIEATIRAFFRDGESDGNGATGGGNDDDDDEILVFPTRMGGRKRKLIHFVSEKLNLAHWGRGKKVSEKTVAVARRRPPRAVGGSGDAPSNANNSANNSAIAS